MLSDRQQRFCEEYMIDLNATQAYIRAGYSPQRAHVTASQLLAKPSIQKYLHDLKAAVAEQSVLPAIEFCRNMPQLPLLTQRMF